MKGFLLIILSFISVCSFCQGQTDENTVKCSVIVKQSFHGWTHCHSNPKPRWYSSSIKNIKKAKNDDAVAFNSGDNEIILQDIEIKRDDTQGSIHYEFASNNIDLKYILDVANIKEKGHYERTISIEYNKHDKIEDGRDAHCFMKKDEGYSFSLSFIIDDPIYLTRKSDNNKCFVIEDKEKLEVSFNDFYENNNADRIFQYRIKDGKWTNFNKSFNDHVSITPKGSVKIGYEDIFGNDPQDSVYLNGSGKQIQIRVLKTLSGKKKIKTPSNVILARFYHRGPTFTVENVRWPACNDSVEVFVNIDSESLKQVESRKGMYKWEAAHFDADNEYDQSFNVFFSSTSIPNRYKILIAQDGEPSGFLSRDDAQTGVFKLQLQLKDEKGDNIKDLAFCTQEFTIPSKRLDIGVVQNKTPLFTIDGKDYHLFSAVNPYVVLEITDKDDSNEGRLPYKIYNKKDSLLAEITGKIKVDDKTLKAKFEKEYNKVTLVEKWAKEWYDSHKDLAKIEKISGTVSGSLGSKIENRKIYAIPLSPNYQCTYLIIETTQVSNQKCTVIKGSCLSNYRQISFSQKEYGKNPFYISIDNKKTWYTASTYADYDLVQENNRFLLLKNNNGYCVLDLKNDVSPQKRNLPTDVQNDISKAFIDGNGDIVYVNGKTIRVFKYQNGDHSWKEDTVNKRVVLFAPNSAKNVVYEGKNVKYTTTKDGESVSYREYYEIGENDFVKIFKAGNALYLPKDAFEERYERLWQQYYLQNAGYNVHGIKINQNDTLILKDNDGCEYTIPYRVNVLDDLKIDEVAKSNPQLGNSADGTAELKVTSGGTVDYYYNGEKIKGPKTINLSGLKWGANEVVFTDEKMSTIKTYIVYLTPQVTATSNAQTCAEANGSIAVSGSDTNTQWRCYNSKVAPIEYTKLTGLKAGQYVVQGIYGGNWINVDTIEVEDKIFSASFLSKNDAPTIGGKGTAIIKVRNVDGNLSWFEGDEKIDDCSYNAQNSIATVPLSKGTHVIVASDNKNCPSAEEKVTIGGPVMTNAEVVVENENGNVSVNLSAGFEKVPKRKIVLYNEQKEIIASSQNNELQIDNVNADGIYNLELQYEVYGKNGITQKLNLFENLTPLRLTTATQYTADTLRCYGTKDIVKVAIDEKKSNIGDKVEYRIGSSKWKTLSSDGKTEGVDAGNCSITYMTDTTEVEDFAKVVNRATYTKELTIKPGKKYDHDVEFNDVVCLGKDKGSIVLTPDSSRTIENVWLCKDNVDYKSGVISGLEAGTYTIKVVDGLCQSKEDVRTGTISAPKEKLKIVDAIITTDPTCHEKDGVIELEVSGGWGGYRKITDLDEYNKDNESYLEKVIASDNGILRFDSISSGKRDFTIVDEGLCVLTYSIEIPEYKNPYITKAELDATSCYGTSDGAIRILSVQTNSSKVCVDSVYIRKDDEETKKAYDTIYDGLPVGDYKLLLVDENGCKADNEFTVHISEPEPLKVEARLLDGGRIRYKGGSEGRMEVKVSGGNAGIDSVFYNNSNVLVSTGVPYIVEGMSAGPISITASDRYNCPCNDTTLTFIEPEEPITIEAESQAALCHAMTGSVKVTATGGWGDHRIRLVGERESRNSGDKSEVTFQSLYAGDYKIEVEDKYGAKATQSVRVDAPEPISHELITTPDNCDGNGSATIKLSGGMPDYTTIFVVGTDTTKIAGSTVNIGNLVGGREYTLATRDANTCESVITFPQPDNRLKAEIKYVYNANGSATLTAEVKGGIAPYVYKWRNVSGGEELGTSSTQTVTKSGLYRLEIADASGCSYKTMQDVLMAGSIVMRVKSVTRATTPDNDNGTATIICKATQTVNLRLYHLETDTWTSSITMQDETTIKLKGLQWGHYCVEGELDNGNMQTAMFFIAPYEPMEVTKMDVKHVSAPGRNDARVVVDFVGGIAPYVVNDTAAFETSHIELTNLAAGSIALSVADSAGNVLTKDVEILEPEPLVVTSSKVDSASCFSYSDGSVQLTATGGWPGYQFANGNGDYRNSAYFGSLNAGERIFKVVDKYGVEDSVLVTISEPDLLRASVATIDSVWCKGDNNGAAHFTVTGGTAPYRTTYEKETLDGTDVAQLLAGTYVMKFTDSHQCKSPDTISIYIPEPDLLELANDYVTHTTCELDNGKIAIEVKGGSLPYRYEWTENGGEYGGAKTVGMSRSEAENLKQNGLYHIDITDLHGCKTQYEKRIEHSENPRVLGVATTDVLCYGSSDGIAEVDSSQVKWGYPKANYSLTWSQGQTGVMSVNTLPAGIHTVRITDDNNCTTTREFTVGTPEPVKNHLASVRDALCYSYSDGRIETHTTGGVGDYTYVWNTGETTSYADSLKAGMYKVIVTDSHECKDSATYEVTEPEELKVNLGDDVLICPGNIHVFDAGEYATYSWRNAASGEEIETERHLATGEEGDYAIKVTDEIGCIARDTVNLRIGENALQANFLMASDAAVNDTIVLIELSNMPVDSVRWQYDKLMTVDVEEAEEYMFPLMAESTGRYYITMWAYSGGCESFEQKFIDIYEAVEDSSNFKIGYDPLIKQAKVSPNPNDGEFSLIVVLREKADVDVMVHAVNNGRQVEHVVLKDSDKYNTRFNIRQWGSGIFVLSIVSGTERRAIKVLCVR